MVTDFGANRRKLSDTHSFILCAGIPQWMGWEDRFKTAPPMSFPRLNDKNWINFGLVTPQFCRRICAGRVTRWAFATHF